MTGLLDHIRKVNSESRSGRTVPEKLPEGPFIYHDKDGDIEYEFDARILRKGGDERKDGDGNVYFIPLEILPEFEFHDETLDTDAAFWEWMDTYVTKHQLKPVRTQKQRTIVKASEWGLGQYQSASKYLSDRWKGTSYFSDVGNDAARKYAVALQSVQTTIRVVDTHERRMAVRLADTDSDPKQQGFSPTSATNFNENTIWVSACALADTAIEQGEGVDVTTGFALHEASHAQYTTDLVHVVSQPTRLTPLSVAGLLFNIMEDMRIEAKTAEVFPGFTGYFEKAIEYMWARFASQKSPHTWGPELNDKLNAVIQMIKWPEQYRPIYEADPRLKDEAEWWQDWVGRYTSGQIQARPALVEAIKRFDDEDKQAMDDLRGKEQQAKLDQESLEDAIRKAIELMDPNGTIMRPCSSLTNPMGHDKHLDKNKPSAEVAQRAARLVEMGVKEESDFRDQFPTGKSRPNQIISMRPVEDDQSRHAYHAPDAGLVQRMRAAFHLRPSAMEWTDRLRKSGSVDEDEVWRAGTGDMRFFEQRTIESAPDTSIGIMVDGSGSMNGHKMDVAVQAAAIVHACLKDINGVNVHVWSHTAGVNGGGTCTIFKIWERGEPLTRLGLMHTQASGNNFDGYALAWGVRELVREGKPDEQRILFIISDGLPNGNGVEGQYGGAEAMKHIREVGDWAERQDVTVIQIAVGGVHPSQQAAMYKHWVPFDGDLTKLPSQMMGILRKVM